MVLRNVKYANKLKLSSMQKKSVANVHKEIQMI